MKKLYKVGIYCRLSVDDASNSAKAKGYIPADESASIENQYELLSKFVMLNGWTEVKAYRDDGYSGGNFQRPGFLEMLEDARHGLINLILVKDLSRLGRDFVEVGRYTDVIFPSLGCRFVSVLDCLDSEGDNTDMLHFRSLMNDYHLKDLSGKIKSVLHAKMRSGQYVAAYAPYGYRKSEEDRHRLVIDEEAAAVVRWMFELRRTGMAYGKIAGVLNGEGILSPRWYWAVKCGSGSCKYAKLSGLVALALAQPCVQQLQDGFLHLLGRIGAREVFAQLVRREDDVVALRLFLLHHDVQHGVVVELAAAGELFHTLRLRKRGRCLFAVDGSQEHLLFLRLEVGDFHGGGHADLLLVHHLLKLR